MFLELVKEPQTQADFSGGLRKALAENAAAEMPGKCSLPLGLVEIVETGHRCLDFGGPAAWMHVTSRRFAWSPHELNWRTTP
jgi:hypothetical protein